MELLLLSADDLHRALPIEDAIAAVAGGFAALSRGEVSAPQRGVVRSGGGTGLLMGAALPGAWASKAVQIVPGNRQRGLPVTTGLVTLCDPESGVPRALLDGTALTSWRTAAAVGLATDLLAPADARCAAVIGCGGQGSTQVLALDAVRNLEEIRVCSRRPESARGFCARAREWTRARLVPLETAKEAVAGAEVVSLATASSTPVLAGAWLAPATHVNGTGSYRPDMCEVDGALIAGAQVFVDHRPAALAEAGELIAAVRNGHTRPEDWIELGTVVAGEEPWRRHPSQTTFFKSVGHGVQDAVCAAAAVARAEQLGLGRVVEL